MATYEASNSGTDQPGAKRVSGLAAGFILFAGILMVLLGSWYFIAGISGLLNGNVLSAHPNFDLEISTRTLAWIQTAGGMLLVAAGIWLWAGSKTARLLSILIAIISTVVNFYSIPYYPAWSVMMLIVSLGLLWALTTQGRRYENTINH